MRWVRRWRRIRRWRCNRCLNPPKSPPGRGALLKNPDVNKGVNILQNGKFIMFVALKLIEPCLIEVGGFCMGYGYFDRNRGGGWYSLIRNLSKPGAFTR